METSAVAVRGALTAFAVLLGVPLTFLAFWPFPPFWQRDIFLFGPLVVVLAFSALRARINPSLMSLIAIPFAPLLLDAALWGLAHAFDQGLFDRLVGIGVAAIPSFAFALWVWWGARRRRVRVQRPRAYLGLLIVAIGVLSPYAYGIFALVDEQFDQAAAHHIQTRVLYRRIIGGKIRENLVTLASWAPGMDDMELSVPSNTYSELKIGDVACVSLHPGLLHARWVEVNACNTQPRQATYVLQLGAR